MRPYKVCRACVIWYYNLFVSLFATLFEIYTLVYKLCNEIIKILTQIYSMVNIHRFIWLSEANQ